MTTIPDIPIKYVDGYAILLGDNFDTVQECYCVEIPSMLAQRLDAGQKQALDRHEGQGTAFEFGGDIFQVWSGGSQGNRWVIEDDDLQLHFRTDKPGWNLTVRYRAAGLWECGLDAIRERVQRLIRSECVPIGEDWCRLSRVDYAFDFYSPDFSKEQFPGLIAGNLLLTSGVKAGIVFTSQKNETVTIGMNRAGVQIQIYDKGKEITDISGKTWMYKIWEREGYYPPDDKKAKDIWRVEIRFGKDFLKDRNIRTIEAFRENLKELLSEALMRRRLVIPTGQDTHRERWGLHPLWAAVWAAAGAADEYIPVGRQITMRREEYKEMLIKQMAGTGRALSVCEAGHYNRGLAERNGYRSVEIAMEDEKHLDKVARAVERQRFIDEAR